MQLLSCHNGQLHADKVAAWSGSKTNSFTTGLRALDELLPNRAFARGAVHELLALPSHPSPFFVALMLARAAMTGKKIEPQINTDEHRLKIKHESRSSAFIRGSENLSGAIVWCDPLRRLYPPAVAALGVPLQRLFVLHPESIADENWAIAECLRCRGVSATIASPRRLSRIEARRFQLAAERGGGIGILLRPYDRTANIYAAATRWLIAPARGERTVQKWRLQLIHAHGGRIGQSVILEHRRETNDIQAHAAKVHSGRAAKQLADRPVQAAARAQRRATA